MGRQLPAAGAAELDPRSQGWTVVAEARFASLADMRYYDEGDAAHATLREASKAGALIAGGPAGVLTVYFDPEVRAGGEELL